MNSGAGEQQVCVCWLIWCGCHSATGQYMSKTCMSHLDNYVMASFIMTLKMVHVAKFDWHSVHSKEVWWLRLLVAGLSPHWPRFSLGLLCVGHVVDKMTLGQIFLWVLKFSPIIIIPPMPHAHSLKFQWYTNGKPHSSLLHHPFYLKEQKKWFVLLYCVIKMIM